MNQETQRHGRSLWHTAGHLSVEQKEFVTRIRNHWANGTVGVEPTDTSGRLLGPFDLMAASPGIGAGILDLAERFTRTSLTPAERELVILLVAARHSCSYMWAGHAPLLAAQGISQDALSRIGSTEWPSPDAKLQRVYRVARLLAFDGDLDDTEFNLAEEALGSLKLQEIVWVIGLYSMLALAMRVARTPPPAPRA